MNKYIIFTLTLFTLFTLSCSQPHQDKDVKNGLGKTLYTNGNIITMEGEIPAYADAIIVKDGVISFVGDEVKAKERLKEYDTIIDLQGKTLLPGFIDGHSHFASFGAQAIGAQILPPPDAKAKDIATIIQLLKEWNTSENRALTGWIFGLGFDDSVLVEKRFPTKHDLDQVSTEFPIMVIHISAHFVAVNSKGLEVLGITANTPNPEGGIIRREISSSEPNGVLEELAAIPHILGAIAPKSEEASLKFFEAGQKMALSFGYTTAQEGRAMKNHEFLVKMAQAGNLKLDVVSYIDYLFADKYMTGEWDKQDYTNGYRIGGMKVTLDGSPQGRTAWRTKSYLIPPEGANKDYSGYPAIPKDYDVRAIYEKAFTNNWQVLSHANGDAAVDQMIRVISPLAKKYGQDNRRFVLIHGQYIREDQLDSLKDLEVIASLFPLHTFYWGDWHRKLIGKELGDTISPVKTALSKGVKVTIHSDAPVALPNLMRVVWTAVSRTSRSGKVIGEKERLTAYEALKAITDWSAYQHFEEQSKGTLSVGKKADLVILDNNPLTVPVNEIKDILVLETIKNGASVFIRD